MMESEEIVQEKVSLWFFYLEKEKYTHSQVRLDMKSA